MFMTHEMAWVLFIFYLVFFCLPVGTIVAWLTGWLLLWKRFRAVVRENRFRIFVYPLIGTIGCVAGTFFYFDVLFPILYPRGYYQSQVYEGDRLVWNEREGFTPYDLLIAPLAAALATVITHCILSAAERIKHRRRHVAMPSVD